jgi:hypothetical protein
VVTVTDDAEGKFMKQVGCMEYNYR